MAVDDIFSIQYRGYVCPSRCRPEYTYFSGSAQTQSSVGGIELATVLGQWYMPTSVDESSSDSNNITRRFVNYV